MGHIPKNIGKNVSLFLTLPHCSMEVDILGKRVNRGSGYGLKIPVRYHFLGPAKAIDWSKNKLETVKKELECNVSKCLK